MLEKSVEDIYDYLKAFYLNVSDFAVRDFLNIEFEIVNLEKNFEVFCYFKLTGEVNFVADDSENVLKFLL